MNPNTESTQASGQPAPGRRHLLGWALAGAAAAGAAGIGATTPAPAQTAALAPTRRRFAGQVVMVTGATSGIGRAAALQFAEEGAKVVFCGRREVLGREVEQLIRSRQGEATYIRADVRQEKDVEAFVAAAVRQYGRLDVAFNNAGITVEKPLHEYTSAEWDDVHHTNVRGVFLAMKYQLPHMIAAKKGSIVVTSSTAALSSTAKTDFVRRLAGMANLPDLVWDVAISQWAKAKLPGVDPETARTLLVNLLDNAVRHSPLGGRVTVRLRGKPPTAVLEVLDDGPGIPDAHLARVFDRFYRVPGQQGTGSGLGLAICQVAAARLGGTLTLANRPDAPGLVARFVFNAVDRT